MVRTTEATPAGEETYQLGEGPRWDAASQRLLWVDIHAGAVHEGRLDDGLVTVTRRHLLDEMVGAALPREGGGLVVAGQEHVLRVSPDGAVTRDVRVVPAGSGRRCNDAATDPAGRLLVGTLALEGDSDAEVLVRLEADGSLTTLDDDLGQANGIAWSVDGRLLYSVDTARRTVFVRDHDPATGATGARRAHLVLDDDLPDGITVDADDHLWVALFGSGEVRRYAPDGSVTDVVRVPAPNTTSMALAGEDLRTLVITTAAAELEEEQRAEHPLSGRLFSTRVATPGLPATPWRGAEAAERR